MSTPESTRSRADLLEQLAEAGRELSDATVLFHAVVAERAGLGPSDWKTLSILEGHGPMTAGELSQRSGLAPASVTGILDRLEGRGWIERQRDPADRRRVIVAYREAAAVDLGALFGGFMRLLNELYGQYSERDLALLASAMREIAARQRQATVDLQDG